MFELSARTLAGFIESARNGSRHQTQNQNSKLVSRRESALVVLGTGTGLPSHRAHHDELRFARSLAAPAGRRAGKKRGGGPTKLSRDEKRAGGYGPRNCFASGPSALATQRRRRSGRRGRTRRPQTIAFRLQHRNRRRPRPAQRQNLAHRTHG